MIHVLFVPGMFGSTVEAVLQKILTGHTKDLIPMFDGSMHSFDKECHPLNSMELKRALANTEISISTPIFPMVDMKLDEILIELHNLSDSKIILIAAKSFIDAELNLLFQYHKIVTGSGNSSFEIFFKENENIKKWNKHYTNWDDMKPWEFREFFSLYYPTWITEWVDPVVDEKFNLIKVYSSDILYDIQQSFNKIINFLSWDQLYNNYDFERFFFEWVTAQQYILNEFYLIEDIITHTLVDKKFEWGENKLSIIGQAIVQKRLRDIGYELKCYGLDEFPTNTKTLVSLLYKQ